MKNTLFKGRSTRTKIFTVITVVAVLLLLCLNLLLTYLGAQRLIYIDLTPEGFYRLSDNMEIACEEIFEARDENGDKRLTEKIEFTFCADPDVLTSSDDLRATYFMALAIRNMYPDDVVVKTVNVTLNPTSVSKYTSTSRDEILPTDLVISYGSRYRVVSAPTFWWNDFSYNGEYRVASILASLTAIERPVAYFLTGHGESVYDPEVPESEDSKKYVYFKDLLEECGLLIKTLDITAVEAIPSDAALVIINNPTADFVTDPDRFDEFGYISDLEKIDRYLVENEGSLMFNKAYDVKLPELESLLKEWGILFGDGVVIDEYRNIAGEGEPGSAIMGVYNTDTESFGYQYYGEYAALDSAPQFVITNTGYVSTAFPDANVNAESGSMYASRQFASFLTTSDKAVAREALGSAVLTADVGAKTVVGASVRSYLDSYTSETTYAYVFCANSEDFFTDKLLSEGSYANYNVVASVVRNISRVDKFASIDLGGESFNSSSFGGKQTVSTTMSDTASEVYSPDATEVVRINKGLSKTNIVVYSVLVFAVPVAIFVFAAVVYVKRRNM